MNEQEIYGRLNGLSIAVENALIEVFTLKHGSSQEAARVLCPMLRRLAQDVEETLSESDYRKGTVDSLTQVAWRLEGIFKPSKNDE